MEAAELHQLLRLRLFSARSSVCDVRCAVLVFDLLHVHHPLVNTHYLSFVICSRPLLMDVTLLWRFFFGCVPAANTADVSIKDERKGNIVLWPSSQTLGGVGE